jgi:hypothetical protein
VTVHQRSRRGTPANVQSIRGPRDLYAQARGGVEPTQIGVLDGANSWLEANEATNIREIPDRDRARFAAIAQQQPLQPPMPPAPGPLAQGSATPQSQNRGFVLAPGGRAGKYELREKLGQGTFGYVFAAHDMDLDRGVAFKVLNPSHQTNTDIVARFLQEARASARIKHPGIVTVLDCGRCSTAAASRPRSARPRSS